MDRFDQLEEEADALVAGLNSPPPADAPTPPPPDPPTEASPEAPSPAPAEPEPHVAEATTAEEVAPAPADTAGETAEEETVPLSRYKNAERLMHAKAQEAADLKRQVAQLQAELDAKNAPEPPPTADPNLSEFDEFYPEIARPVKSMLSKIEQKLAHADQRFAQMDEHEAEAAHRHHWETIYTAHPDAAEIAADPGFQVWASEQAPLVQQAIQQGSARDVNHVLSLYKAAAQPATPPPDKLAQARQAAGPNVGRVAATPTQHRFTREQIHAMSQSEYEANEAEIDRQVAAGLIA